MKQNFLGTKVANETTLFSRNANLSDLVRMRRAARKLNRITVEFEKVTTRTMNGIETMTTMTEDNLLDMLGSYPLLGNKQQPQPQPQPQQSKSSSKKKKKKKKRAYHNMMVDRKEGSAKYTTDHLLYMRQHQFKNILPLLLGLKAGKTYGIWDMYAEMAKEMKNRTTSGIEAYLRKQKLRLQDMQDGWLVVRMKVLGVYPWPRLNHTRVRKRMAKKLQKKARKSKKTKK